jgi:hypothetical protein
MGHNGIEWDIKLKKARFKPKSSNFLKIASTYFRNQLSGSVDEENRQGEVQ